MSSRYVIALPDDTAQPILDAINHAASSIRVKMFMFSDPSLMHAIIAAQHRGVKVRIMLNPARRSGEKENDDSRKKLTDAGVEVIDSNPAFDLTHEKSMVSRRFHCLHSVPELGDKKHHGNPRLRRRHHP